MRSLNQPVATIGQLAQQQPRPPTTAVTSIAEKLKCQQCRGQAAPPRVVKLTERYDG